MKLTQTHKHAINEAARRTCLGAFAYCEVAERVTMDATPERQAMNLYLLTDDGELDDTDLFELYPLSRLKTVEDHPKGASLDVYVRVRYGRDDTQLSHNLYAWIDPDGKITVMTIDPDGSERAVTTA